MDGCTYEFLLNHLSDDDGSNTVDYHLVSSGGRDAGIECEDTELHQSTLKSVFLFV